MLTVPTTTTQRSRTGRKRGQSDGAAAKPAPPDVRPYWLTVPCPPWCVENHQVCDHPEDRSHRDFGSSVALRQHQPVRDGADVWAPSSLVLMLSQHVDSAFGIVTLLRDEDLSTELRLTAIEARALSRHLAAAADRLDGRPQRRGRRR